MELWGWLTQAIVFGVPVLVEPVVVDDCVSWDELHVDVERSPHEVGRVCERAAEGLSVPAAPANGDRENGGVGQPHELRAEASQPGRTEMAKRCFAVYAREACSFREREDVGSISMRPVGAMHDGLQILFVTTASHESTLGEDPCPAERWPALERCLHDPAQMCSPDALHDSAQERRVDRAPVVGDHDQRSGNLCQIIHRQMEVRLYLENAAEELEKCFAVEARVPGEAAPERGSVAQGHEGAVRCLEQKPARGHDRYVEAESGDSQRDSEACQPVHHFLLCERSLRDHGNGRLGKRQRVFNMRRPFGVFRANLMICEVESIPSVALCNTCQDRFVVMKEACFCSVGIANGLMLVRISCSSWEKRTFLVFNRRRIRLVSASRMLDFPETVRIGITR